jgi:hypothetical protein
MRREISLTMVLMILLHSSIIVADTYKCTNAKGKVNFTDQPCKNAQQTTLNTPAPNTLPEPSATPAPVATPRNLPTISIVEAYAAIPHKRTVFNAKESPLAITNTFALTHLFEAVERAIVLKIMADKALGSKNAEAMTQTLEQYSSVIKSLLSLDSPNEIKPAQTLIISAIEKHQAHFTQKQTAAIAGKTHDLSTSPEITSASADLQRAYSALIKSFPQETVNNKTAFYDYLCALDFL